jgi:molybdopterin-guanine dinucleotide biosynthesis protein A
VRVGGLLLAGGASTRLGAAKARLESRGERLVDRTARVLGAVAAPVVEVGPGWTNLPATREEPPGSGPLAATAAGAAWLAANGAPDAFLLLALDLPNVSEPLLRWLAEHPAPGSVVPEVDGHPQPLCARFDAAAGEVARALVARGERSMRALLAAIPVTTAGEEEWGAVADAAAFADVDTADAARRAGLEMPGGSLDAMQDGDG